MGLVGSSQSIQQGYHGVLPSMLVTVELLESWLLDPSAPSMLAVDPLDVAIFVQKRTHGLVGHAQGSQLAALLELFSILGHTYYSQNYSGIISTGLGHTQTVAAAVEAKDMLTITYFAGDGKAIFKQYTVRLSRAQFLDGLTCRIYNIRCHSRLPCTQRFRFLAVDCVLIDGPA